MSYKIILPIFLIASAGIARPAPAEETFTAVTVSDVTAESATELPSVWSFNDCIAWATANSTDIRRTILDILQADQDIASAKDAWLPTVGFNTGHTFSNYPSGDKGNSYASNYDINVGWTAWEGNIRKYRLESSRLLRRQQELRGEDVVKTIKLGILQAYINIMYAKEAVSIASGTLEVSTGQAERALRLMESGRISKVDYAQIESQRAQDSYNLIQSRNNLESARMNLKKILELGIDQSIEIEDVAFTDAEVHALLPAMNETYSLAAAWLPGIRSNELNKEIYANDVRIAKAGNLPTVSVNGGLGTGYATGGNGWARQMGQNFGENIGLNLSIPIFDGNATKRAVAKARLAEFEYNLAKDNLLDDLSQTIEGLYIDANNARAKYTSGITQLEATQLTDELINRQFELGLVNPLELLTAHNNYLNARLELLQSKYMAILANKTIGYYATGEVSLP